jgi:hypothetical protein|nr:MAG TPA: hypothetical protein [Caudoviricetes sp.]
MKIIKEKKVKSNSFNYTSPEKRKELLKNNPVIKIYHNKKELKDYFDTLASLK